MPTPATRGPGRRPGGPDTRGEILAAARAEFAEQSYAGTTIRAIAARAGVDPALVHHYFGTKRYLFTACLDIPLDPGEVIARLAAAPASGRGAVMVRLFLEVWSDAAWRAPIVALIRSATTEPEAAAVLRQFLEEVMTPAVRPMLDGDGVDLRLQLAISQLIGIAIVRHVVGASPLAQATVDELVDTVGPVVQHYLDGS
ncbi:TetR family transcriptional regulator [Georgenia yuyongxinii]|uniref:TetR/AcrR family transcriptional regulator n=1 Tax=Georgenia yuyongxinii TaxID=2589797 RepID=A0A552WRF9_9MICO|nr:TetR family transcriptional regulator [Georgenia yuyongxinii]TRW45199.1 TetR/AcrR family transcriptional regulator [Georgenia yuyongxinii]